MTDSRPTIFWLALGWMALVAVASLWQAMAFTGWYRWLAEWQMAQFGQYQPVLTGVLPGILLAAPALSWLGKRDRALQDADAAAGDPAATNVRARRMSFWAILLSAAVAIGAYLWSQTIPDGSGPSTRLEVASAGTPPSGPVELIGELDSERAIVLEQTNKGVITKNYYIPVVAPGAKGQPIRYLWKYYQQGYSGRDEAPPIIGYALSGVLVENGLPGEASATFAREKIVLASPHYLLTSASGQRDNFYIAAALGALFAIMFAAAAIGQTIRIGKLRRENRA